MANRNCWVPSAPGLFRGQTLLGPDVVGCVGRAVLHLGPAADTLQVLSGLVEDGLRGDVAATVDGLDDRNGWATAGYSPQVVAFAGPAVVVLEGWALLQEWNSCDALDV